MCGLVLRNGKDLELLNLINNGCLYEEGVIVRKLMRESGMNKSTFYRFLNIYEEKAFIEKKTCDFDTRAKRIFITDKGKKALSWWERFKRQAEEDMKRLGFE